jgi:hypothetical protein
VTLDPELWPLIRCVVCRQPADHALELLLPIPKGTLTPAVIGFCTRHYKQAQRTPQWKELPIVEATALEPRGVG